MVHLKADSLFWLTQLFPFNSTDSLMVERTIHVMFVSSLYCPDVFIAIDEALLSLQFFIIILVIFLAEVAGAVVILVFKPAVGRLRFQHMCYGFNSNPRFLESQRYSFNSFDLPGEGVDWESGGRREEEYRKRLWLRS